MDAAAHIQAKPCAATGQSQIVALQSQGPVQLQDKDGVAYLSLAPGSGDDLWLDINVEANATLAVRGLGGFITPADPFGVPTHLTVTATVADGGTLDWQPQPTVSAQGSRFRSSTFVSLGEDSKLTYVDDVCLGKQHETPGAITSSLYIKRRDEVLVRHTNRMGGDAKPEDQDTLGLGIRRMTTMIRSTNQPAQANPICWKMAAFDYSVAADMEVEDLHMEVMIVRRTAAKKSAMRSQRTH